MILKQWLNNAKELFLPYVVHIDIDALVQDCSNSIANALELL